MVEYGTCAGVSVPAPAEPRRRFDRLRPWRDTPEHRPFEGAMASVHRAFTRPDDDVVIVGGGYGITTTVAASAGADVTVFEPDPARGRAIGRTLQLNDVDPAAVTRRRAVVGELTPLEAAGKGLDPATIPVVPPGDLPACDVLELDCEGAERVVLDGLDPPTLPPTVAVEIHPIKLDGATEPVLARLRELGYDVVRRLTHDGATLDRETFDALLEGETPAVDDPDHQTFPPVVVARR